MNEADNECVAEEMETLEKGMTDNVIPEKSKNTYKRSYEKFITWKIENKVSSVSEDVLLNYFKTLHVKWKPSSLATEFSKLKSMFSVNEQIDISKFSKLQNYLKNIISERYQVKKAETFSQKDIEKFIDEAPDKTYLSYKVAIIFGVMGACRRQELHRLMLKDVKDLHENKTLIISIMADDNKVKRKFIVTGKFYDICTKYMKLRPVKCKNPNFFVRFCRGKCFKQNIGINYFGQMGKIVAEYLNLPNAETYTGHCFRRTATSLVRELKKSSEPEEMVILSYASRVPAANNVLLALQEQGASPAPVREDRTQQQSKTDSSDTNASNPPRDPLGTEQCRFCGEFNANCIKVTSDKPYLVHNRTAITLNGLSVDLDFNTLPNAVCPHCDEKLYDIYNFVNKVKAAHNKLTNVVEENRAEIETLIIKTEITDCSEIEDYEIANSNSFSGTDFVERNIVTHKRKNSENKDKKQKEFKTTKEAKMKSKVENENYEFIIDIKEENIKMDVEYEAQIEHYGHYGISDTGTAVDHSELEYAACNQTVS